MRLLYKTAVIILFFALFSVPSTFAYKILYAEQFYKLYHSHYIQYPEDSAENIYYLENALKRPFVNPLNALAIIKTEKEWERYRYMFTMHIYLKLIEQWRLLGVKYDKFDAYFYNYPWKQENLKSLQMAEKYYKNALYYWDKVLEMKAEIDAMPYLYIEGMEYWEEERIKIEEGDIDYKEFIELDLKRLYEVREAFENMNPDTY